MAIKVSGTEVISDDKRILNNEDLPDIRPSLLLDFANSKTLDPRITFTRGSTGTYWDGKTTAKAEENLHQYSQSTTGKADFSITATNNAATAPDGTTTAALLTLPSSGTGGPRYYGTENTGGQRAFTSGVTYTVSAYFKAGTATYCYISMRTTGGNIAASEFNLSTGSASTATRAGSFSNQSSTMTSVGNGWYRCTLTATAGATTTDGYNFFGVSDGTGIGGSGYPDITLSGQTVYIWGLQKEIRSSATAYTATTSSPIVKYQPVLQTAASGEARFDHDPVTGESKGLLIEEARTNLVTQSENASGWADNELVNYFNSVIAPDGTQTANWAVKQSGNTRPYLGTGNPTTMNGTYTGSCFFKKHDTDYVQLSFQGDGDAHANFDLANGTVTVEINCTAGIEAVGNGWYRCHFTRTTTLGDGLHISPIAESNADRLPTFTSYCDMIYWGAQVETGSFPTSYIPTSGSTVTRSVDSALMIGANLTNWFSNEESTVFLDFERRNANQSGTYPMIAALSDGTTDNVLSMYLNNGETFFYETRALNSTNAILSTTVTTQGSSYKVAGTLKTNDMAASFDGATVTTDTDALNPPNISRLDLGSRASYLPYTGTIKKFAYYPQRLSNATLQAMTEE